MVPIRRRSKGAPAKMNSLDSVRIVPFPIFSHAIAVHEVDRAALACYSQQVRVQPRLVG